MTDTKTEIRVLKPLECLHYFHGRKDEIRKFLSYSVDPDIVTEWNRAFKEDRAICAHLRHFSLYRPKTSSEEIRDWTLLCAWIALNQDSENAFLHAAGEHMRNFAYIMLDFFSSVAVSSFPNDSIFAGTTVFNYLYQLASVLHFYSDMDHKQLFCLLAKTHLEDEDMLDSIIHHYSTHEQFDIKKDYTIN